ncbi:MAG: pantetheine-phosphate adenylyltransferase [Lentisphaeria bacterium]|nr:pantetheine-phosphate adenylyltransferase [Lentisphaeria bacterium]
MKRVLYPGSFDPFTIGHFDLVARACKLFDEVIVGVAVNPGKNPLFTLQERADLIAASCKDFANVKVVSFEGLLIDAVQNLKADAVLRGLRAFSDFEYELQMALTNRSMLDSCETIFMMPNANTSFISSHMVKEIAFLHGKFEPYVPASVADAIHKKLEF